MGNQPSKSKSGTSTANTSSQDLTLPISKSDTVGSTRSFRGSIKSKLSSKSDKDKNADSPPSLSTSTSIERPVGANFDAAMSPRAKRESRGVSNINTSVARNGTSADGESADTPLSTGTASSPKTEQPPSPVHGDLTKGHHALEASNGEVGNVSDMPAGSGGGSIPQHATMQPGESILMKRPDAVIPIATENMVSGEEALASAGTGTSPGGIGMGALKSIDLDDMINRLLDAGYAGKVTKGVCLKNAEIQAVCSAAREVLLSQPPLVELSAPVKIVGDVHGQYSDLIRMFEMCGFPPHSNYLFLGDYVDRGKQSLETILLLLCYKLKFPENFFLLRGNHECASVSRVYGFYDECKRRTSVKIWKSFIDTFNTLPLAAIVASKIFCVHGGLSPSLHHMDDIRSIARPTDVPDYGLLNDLLWSDPADMQNDWEENERGVSYCFGKKVIYDFLAKHDFDLVCRAHMVVEDGYEFFNDRTLVTVFSAPNYCGMFDNWGAVMSVSKELLCSFELLKPLDGAQLKMMMKKSKNARKGVGVGFQSPPANMMPQSV